MEKWLECMENLWKTYPFPTSSHWDKQERTAGKSQTQRRGNNQDVRELKKYWQVCDQSRRQQEMVDAWQERYTQLESQAWE
jgi:hypothetical protein